MDIAFGHSNMDFDCLGSLILIKKMFPGYRLVRSSRLLPAAQIMCDFYGDYFDFLNLNDIAEEKIEHIIIVDTCTLDRVKEYFAHIKDSNPCIKIFDHHKADHCDIAAEEVVRGRFGATTSLLGKIAMKDDLVLGPEEATIALTAIYADTGRLLYDNVTREDYEVSAWLLGMGASLKLARSFLETVKVDEQIAVLNQLKPSPHLIQGHSILLSYLELEENVAGLAAVVEKIMEIYNPDAYFAVFSIPKDKTILLITRSQKKVIDLDALLSVYGGGGHAYAASARIQGRDGKEFFEDFRRFLDYALEPALRARDIMTKNVFAIHETTSLRDASMFLERVDLSAIPVMDREGKVTGFISLRDIMKGRKHGKMHVPVTAYMSSPVISAGSKATIREIEQIFFKNRISYLPILDEGKLLGIVSRWDYLQLQKRSTADGPEA